MSRGNDTTSRLGVATAEMFFSRHNWLFREQYLHDWGIDAHVESKKRDRPTGQLVALQIKTGPSWFANENEEGVYFAIGERHFNYWLRHQLPVYVILHDPDTAVTIWQKVDRSLIKRSDKGVWYIRIPRSNVLDENALRYFEESAAGDPTSFKRGHLALDYELMLAVYNADRAYLQVCEMNHKTLSMRGAWFRFGHEDKQPADVSLERNHPERGIHEYMAWAFPWLDYTHTQPLEDRTGSVEMEIHKLEVGLNAVGMAFIELERFYSDGVELKDYAVPFVGDDEMNEAE